MAEHLQTEKERQSILHKKPSVEEPAPVQSEPPQHQSPAGVRSLQRKIGNQAVQRLLAQRSAHRSAGFDLDEQTANRIESERGHGQPLESNVAQRMGQNMGQDFSGVRVHTSAESNQLNQDLSARAFTTGKDIFFSQGTYAPQSSGGEHLLAHELTHVAQQSQMSPGGGPMHVTDSGDAYEQEADTTANSLNAPVQRQLEEEEEGTLQRQEDEEEEELG